MEANFNVLATLQQRLQEKNAERDSIKTVITNLETRIRIDRTKGPRPPTENEEQLNFEIKQLEFRRETTSLPLAEEKRIVKQIEGYKAKKSAIKAHRVHLEAMEALSQRHIALSESLRECVAGIDELDKGVRRVQLAQKLNIAPEKMVVITVPIPDSFFGAVIGKDRSRSRAIEEECGVALELQRVEKVMAVTGSEATVERAREMLEDITLGIMKVVDVPVTVCPLLLRNKGAIIQGLRTTHRVKMDLERDRVSCRVRVRGRPAAVEEASAALLAAVEGEESVDMDLKLLPAMLGRGGANLRKMEEENQVAIVVDRAAAQVVVRGSSADVPGGAQAVRDFLVANEEHSCELSLEAGMVGDVVGKGGATIKQLAVASGGAFFDIDRTDRANPVLRIRGTSEKLTAGKAAAEELIATIQRETIRIPVPEAALGAVIGRQGGSLNTIRQSSGASVECTNGVIRIRGDETQREDARVAVEALLEANQTAEVTVDPQLFGVIVGKAGATISKMQSDSGCSITVARGEGKLKLRGGGEALRLAKEAIQVILDANQQAEVVIGPDDARRLLGDKGAVIRGMEKESGAEIRVGREGNNVVILRGSEEQLGAARSLLLAELGMTDSGNCSVFKVEAETLGAVIGRGGSTIKRLQEEHSVSIEVMRSALALRVRGEEEAVSAALAAIQALVDEMQITAVVTCERQAHMKVSATMLRTITDCTGATINLVTPPKAAAPAAAAPAAAAPAAKAGAGLSGYARMQAANNARLAASRTGAGGAAPAGGGGDGGEEPAAKDFISYRIRGPVKAVGAAKEVMTHLVHGRLRTRLVLAPNQARALGEGDNVNRVKKESGADVTSGGEVEGGRAMEVVVEGSVRAVKEAMTGLINILSFFFPSEFLCLELPPGAMQMPQMRDILKPQDERVVCVDVVGARMLVSGAAAAVAASKHELGEALAAAARRCGEVSIDAAMVPQLIGRAGAGLKKLQADTGVEAVDVDRARNVVCVRGPEEAVAAAVQTLTETVETYRRENVSVPCPVERMGGVIGKGGAGVKAIQESSGASLDFDRSRARIMVRGSETAVTAAVAALNVVLRALEAANAVTEVPVPDARMFAVLIGRAGATVRGVQERSGATVDLDRERSVVLLKGNEEAVNKARDEINALIETASAEYAAAAAAREQAQQEAQQKRRSQQQGDESSGSGTATTSASSTSNGASGGDKGNRRGSGNAPAATPAAAAAAAGSNFAAVPVGAKPKTEQEQAEQSMAGKSKNARRRQRKKKQGAAAAAGAGAAVANGQPGVGQDVLSLLMGPGGGGADPNVAPAAPAAATLPPAAPVAAPASTFGFLPSLSSMTSSVTSLLMGTGNLGLATPEAPAPAGSSSPEEADQSAGAGYYVSSSGFKVRL